MNKKQPLLGILFVFASFLVACQPQPMSNSNNATAAPLKVIAAESFLADIAQNVAGERLTITSLMAPGIDPHAFEPTPQDIARLSDSQLLIINGSGLESWLQNILNNVGGQKKIISASDRLITNNGDPHFWLDPNNVIKYVENIRDGLSTADPQGKTIYSSNADAYIVKLKQLDTWIIGQVASIPPSQRLLVTNHESLGYFASHYGFTIIGSVIPNFSTDAAPSAQQMAQLVDAIKATHAKAIFLEVGNNPQLANQIAAETGLKVITDLYSETLSAPDGKAPNYLAMMQFNVQTIVSALQ
jgi:ABC-type Zn uptake system ZnuABC Zn-binding protein ZnuA